MNIFRIVLLIVAISFVFCPVGVRADVYPVLYERGLPDSADDLFVWSGDGKAMANFIPDQAAPEGVSYHRLSGGNTYKGMGVFFCGANVCERNLSRFAGGNMEFFLKASGPVKVEIEAPRGTKGTVIVNGTGQWQAVSLPLNNFGVNLSRVYGPFLITADNVNSAFTMDVDDVRWTVPLPNYADSTVTTVNNGRLFVNGAGFTGQGVAEGFTPVGKYGPAYLWSEDPVNYTSDISLMRAIGVNVVSLYQPPTNRAVLDAFHQAGIKVIMGFPIFTLWDVNGDGQVANNEYVDFSNPVVRQNNIDRALDIVRQWGKHPAVLMWMIGNEINVNTNRARIRDWYELVEQMASAVKTQEAGQPNRHAISFANADVSIIDEINTYDSLLSDIDIWSVHLYRGPSFGNVFDQYRSLNTVKPFFLTEFGCDAYDKRVNAEDGLGQAQCLLSQWKEIVPHLKTVANDEPLVGTLVFQWRDGWWKSQGLSNSQHDTACDWDNPAYPDRCMNEEWWGLVGISADPMERQLRPAYHLMQSAWKPNTFIRGDANCDGTTNITDAIYALMYIFRGGPSPACRDAADANDDGMIDISDAVKTLLVLFSGFDMPEPNIQSGPGPDPTLDLLTCLSSCPLQ